MINDNLIEGGQSPIKLPSLKNEWKTEEELSWGSSGIYLSLMI
jgi:hypothetical protein